MARLRWAGSGCLLNASYGLPRVCKGISLSVRTFGECADRRGPLPPRLPACCHLPPFLVSVGDCTYGGGYRTTRYLVNVAAELRSSDPAPPRQLHVPGACLPLRNFSPSARRDAQSHRAFFAPAVRRGELVQRRLDEKRPPRKPHRTHGGE
jgi:hypothetical protein